MLELTEKKRYDEVGAMVRSSCSSVLCVCCSSMLSSAVLMVRSVATSSPLLRVEHVHVHVHVNVHVHGLFLVLIEYRSIADNYSIQGARSVGFFILCSRCLYILNSATSKEKLKMKSCQKSSPAMLSMKATELV